MGFPLHIVLEYKNGEDTLLEVAFPGMLSEFEMIFISKFDGVLEQV